MKNALEYKILKYLFDNDNGAHLSIEHLEDNKILLQSKIDSLLKSKYISVVYKKSFKKSYMEDIDPKYKIELYGSKYLDSLKSKPFTKYQIIYIPFFIIFGLIGSYKTFFPNLNIGL